MQTAIITGGTGILGSAIAQQFSPPEWNVQAPGRHELNVLDLQALTTFFQNFPPDLLVCSAGITRDQILANFTETAWDQTLAVNLKAARHCALLAAKHMQIRGSGHILFLSSYSALHPPIGQIAYATSKAALLGLTTDLAREFGPNNIRVNAILPGFIDSPMTSHLTHARRHQILTDHLLGRPNTPLQVAQFIHYLHHHLPHTSGQTFQLDSRPP